MNLTAPISINKPERRRPKIVITMPTGGSIHTDTVKSLLTLQSYLSSAGIQHGFSFSTSSFLPHGRAQVCGATMEAGEHQWPYRDESITHIMMIDSDIVFSPSDFMMLLEANVPVAAGAYPYSTEVHSPHPHKRIVAGTWDETYFRQNLTFPCHTISSMREASPDGSLIEVDWLGLGFTLVETRVMRDIPYPWFESEKIVIPPLTDTTSEDVGWCRKVKRAGYKLLLHPGVILGHLKVTNVLAK